MNNTTPGRSRYITLGSTVPFGIVAVFGLMLYGVQRYPASVSQGGFTSLLTSVGSLLAYGAVIVWVR
jgi:hypothetical protein